MPISGNPNATVPYVLLSDRALPPGEQPTFHLRFLTEAQVGHLGELLDAHDVPIARDASPEQVAARAREKRGIVVQVIRFGLVRWERVSVFNAETRAVEAVPYSPDVDLATILTTSEKYELVAAIQNEPSAKESDLKKSASQPESGQNSSAPTAENQGAV